MDTRGGLLALLDLPSGSVLTLDGETVLLKRDDFIGVHGLPIEENHGDDPSSEPKGGLHIVCVRAGALVRGENVKSVSAAASSAATTVGFVFSGRFSDSGNWTWIGRYNPHTEEVSVENDESVARNLRHELQNGLALSQPRRIVAYSQMVSSPRAERWSQRLTNFISPLLLHKRRIQSGAKLIPGTYDEQVDDISTKLSTSSIVDGTSVWYPSIPLLSNTKRDATVVSSHWGTRCFLQALSPTERTALFLARHPTSHALEHVLTRYYENTNALLLGDLQLSYVLFVQLHCYASFRHWRDLIALLCAVQVDGMGQQIDLYTSFMTVLAEQLCGVDDFLDDSLGDNFLADALHTVVATARMSQQTDVDSRLTESVTRLESLLFEKFPIHVTEDTTAPVTSASDEMMDTASDGDDEEDDGPVIVSSDEVDASLERSHQQSQQYHSRQLGTNDDGWDICQRYPFLAAAMNEYTEDIVMACARILDEAKDVTLVREAAAYLQEVEAFRQA